MSDKHIQDILVIYILGNMKCSTLTNEKRFHFMDEKQDIQNLLLSQIEQLSQSFHYDFLYEKEEQGSLCQILLRDDNGSIVATPLSFRMFVNEVAGNGELIFYSTQGEFSRQKFDIYKEDSIVKLLLFIQERLKTNH